MAYRFDDFQQFGKEHLEVMTASSSSLAKCWQTIAAESREYSKKSFENGSAFFEKLRGAKSFESAIQIQSEYAKTFFEGLVGYVTKTANSIPTSPKKLSSRSKAQSPRFKPPKNRRRRFAEWGMPCESLCSIWRGKENLPEIDF